MSECWRFETTKIHTKIQEYGIMHLIIRVYWHIGAVVCEWLYDTAYHFFIYLLTYLFIKSMNQHKYTYSEISQQNSTIQCGP